jgi:hypothetical protein
MAGSGIFDVNNYRDIRIALAWRGSLALLVYGLGWFLLAGAAGGWGAVPQLLFGMGFVVTAAIIVAAPIARLVAEPTGNLFWPSRRFDRPQPMYGIPESKRKKGLYQEAFDGFQAIAEEFPQELKPYVQMIDIAIVDMYNANLARAVLQSGLKTLKDDNARDALSRMHRAISSRLKTPPGPAGSAPPTSG